MNMTEVRSQVVDNLSESKTYARIIEHRKLPEVRQLSGGSSENITPFELDLGVIDRVSIWKDKGFQVK